MESAFEIVTPDSVHNTEVENMKIYWGKFIPIVPQDYVTGLSSLKYISSNKHVAGYNVAKPCEWCIQLNPNYVEDGKRYISVFIWIPKFLRKHKPLGSQSLHAMYQFDIRINGGPTQSKFSSIHKFTEKRPCYGFKKVIPFPKLKINDLRQKDVRIDICTTIMIIRDINDFVFPCTIEDKCCLLNSDGNEEAGSSAPLTDEEEIEKRRKLYFVNHAIKERISDLRKTKIGADLVVRSTNKDHKAHMNVLLARCNNRNIPFKLENIGNREMKVIEMKEVSDSTVTGVLDYCYDDHTKHFNNYRKIIGIVEVACKFNMDNLRNQCTIELACCISPQRFFRVLKAVLSVSDSHDIREFLREYFIVNHAEIRNSITKEHVKEECLLVLTKLFLVLRMF